MNKLIFISIIIIIIITCGLLCLNHNEPTNVVRVGYLPSDHSAAFFVAQAQNQYAKNNITIERYQFNNGGDLMTAMASGDIDVGYVGITPVLSSIQQGVPVKVVSGIQNGGSAIVTNNDSNINNVTDLVGKKIAIPGQSSIQHMLLDYYLSNNGLSMDNVSVTAMKVPFMSNSLRSNQVDAIITYEPYVSLATSIGYGKVVVSSNDILPDHPCCVVVASDFFIFKHPDTLEIMLDIHKNATIYVNEYPEKSASLIPQDILVDPNIEIESLKGINFIYGLNDTYKQSIRDFMQIEIDMGLLKGKLSDSRIFYR